MTLGMFALVKTNPGLVAQFVHCTLTIVNAPIQTSDCTLQADRILEKSCLIRFQTPKTSEQTKNSEDVDKMQHLKPKLKPRNEQQ